ncbi:antitoxin VapB [Sphingobium xanthum]|jgi:antitoxin VapB|uniref:type II toxin-antitoxin system VapB family antitoxin n=1 Tax=Sphingobium xanthum TaxID=1387165 RepID=UPI001C8CA1DA|nr:type II toxin-antitoxin system VapB family antitoxin [Sphingobium xanthum]
MSLFVKDIEVNRMAERLAMLQRVSKTEAVRRALRHELEREEEAPSLVDRGLAFARALRANAGPDGGKPIDKDFIDGLYGEP